MHAPLQGDLEVDPELTGGIMSPLLPENALGFKEEAEKGC